MILSYDWILLFLPQLLLHALCYHHVDSEVVWAVNCGGPPHVDVHGIEYMADPLLKGSSSDYGRSFTIVGAPMQDQILYQTERYDTSDFSYTVPYPADGEYVLTLKFSEVWFSDIAQKIFDVQLNNALTIIKDLDIFSEVGFATALDKHIPFKISNGVLYLDDGLSVSVDKGSFSLDFIKTDRDNPKINAIILTKGPLSSVPQLPPVSRPREQVRPVDTVEHDSDPKRHRRPPGLPRAPDPYESTEYSYLILPVLGTLAASLPIVFCLCKV